MSINYKIFLLLTLGILYGCFSNETKFEGSYITVSESEWQVELIIKNSGDGEYINESWAAGQHENKQVKRAPISWSVEGRVLMINLEGVILKYEYEENLIFDEGPPIRQGPGLNLINTSDKTKSALMNRLWKKPLTL